MPYNAQQIPPIDLRPGRAVGVTLPFDGPACFNSSYTTGEAVKANLIDYFLTNQGERPLNPTYGGGLRSFIFEQINSNTLDSLQEDIQSKISRYFPNVQVLDLEVFQDPDYNNITVSIKYNIVDTAISDEIQIAFN